MFILNKINFHFILSLEAFLKTELLSTINKMSSKLHGWLTNISKYIEEVVLL